MTAHGIVLPTLLPERTATRLDPAHQVLIVERNSTIAELLARSLWLGGYPSLVTSHEQAITHSWIHEATLLAATRIILLDLSVPWNKAEAIVQCIQATIPHPLILLTINNELSTHVGQRYPVFLKPFHPHELIDAITTIFATHPIEADTVTERNATGCET